MDAIQTKNEQETRAAAAKLAVFLKQGDVILLEGGLGAGKTTFTKGLAEGLEIQQMIKSPTYTIIREYWDGRVPLYHMDAYRLEDTGGTELGLEEYFESEGVSVVEWANFIPGDLPDEYLNIKLTSVGEEQNEREIEFKAIGGRYEDLLAKFQKSAFQNGSKGAKR